MLSLAAIDVLCCDSDEVKSLHKRSTYLISDVLSNMKQEITVCTCIKLIHLKIVIVFTANMDF